MKYRLRILFCVENKVKTIAAFKKGRWQIGSIIRAIIKELDDIFRA